METKLMKSETKNGFKSIEEEVEDAICGRNAWVEVNLDNVYHNIKESLRFVGEDVKVLAVVKGNGYGHGSVPVSKTCIEAGATYLGVATVDEGLELRRNGITAPILVLGYLAERVMHLAINEDMALTIFSTESAKAMERVASRLEKVVKVHIKVDTGLTRLGLMPDEVLDFMKLITTECKHLEVEGLFSHNAALDDSISDYMKFQLDVFKKLVNRVRQEYTIPIVHYTGTFATFKLREEAFFDMVRIGLGVYGFCGQFAPELSLKPCMALKARLVRVTKPPPKFGVGYNKLFTVSGDDWIGTVPLGFTDGFSGLLSNKGHVLMKGVRLPILGIICMDLLMINVTKVMPVDVGDEVVLYGKQGDEEITLDDAAEETGLDSIELMNINYRVPRIFIKNGKLFGTINKLLEVDTTCFQ